MGKNEVIKKMSESNKKREKLEKRLEELEDIAKERYMSNIESWADFMLNYLTSEEYDEWSELLDKLNND